MNEITVAVRAKEPELLRTGAPDLEPNIGATTLVRDELGDPVMLVARYEGDLGAYRQALLALPYDTTMRMAGSRNRSRTFGYVGRREVLKRYGCRTCSSAIVAPEAHATIIEASKNLWATFARLLPRRAERDLECAQIIDPAWRFGDTPWTGGVVNVDGPLPYHYDANNLDCWSAMSVIRRGARDGHLHVPQLGLVVECRDGDVVYFPGYNFMHGVTPIRMKGVGSYRRSAVYYSIESMAKCGSAAEELERGKRRRSEMEDGLMARQRGDGLMT